MLESEPAAEPEAQPEPDLPNAVEEKSSARAKRSSGDWKATLRNFLHADGKLNEVVMLFAQKFTQLGVAKNFALTSLGDHAYAVIAVALEAVLDDRLMLPGQHKADRRAEESLKEQLYRLRQAYLKEISVLRDERRKLWGAKIEEALLEVEQLPTTEVYKFVPEQAMDPDTKAYFVEAMKENLKIALMQGVAAASKQVQLLNRQLRKTQEECDRFREALERESEEMEFLRERNEALDRENKTKASRRPVIQIEQKQPEQQQSEQKLPDPKRRSRFSVSASCDLTEKSTEEQSEVPVPPAQERRELTKLRLDMDEVKRERNFFRAERDSLQNEITRLKRRVLVALGFDPDNIQECNLLTGRWGMGSLDTMGSSTGKQPPPPESILDQCVEVVLTHPEPPAAADDAPLLEVPKVSSPKASQRSRLRAAARMLGADARQVKVQDRASDTVKEDPWSRDEDAADGTLDVELGRTCQDSPGRGPDEKFLAAGEDKESSLNAAPRDSVQGHPPARPVVRTLAPPDSDSDSDLQSPGPSPKRQGSKEKQGRQKLVQRNTLMVLKMLDLSKQLHRMRQQKIAAEKTIEDLLARHPTTSRAPPAPGHGAGVGAAAHSGAGGAGASHAFVQPAAAPSNAAEGELAVVAGAIHSAAVGSGRVGPSAASSGPPSTTCSGAASPTSPSRKMRPRSALVHTYTGGVEHLIVQKADDKQSDNAVVSRIHLQARGCKDDLVTFVRSTPDAGEDDEDQRVRPQSASRPRPLRRCSTAGTRRKPSAPAIECGIGVSMLAPLLGQASCVNLSWDPCQKGQVQTPGGGAHYRTHSKSRPGIAIVGAHRSRKLAAAS